MNILLIHQHFKESDIKGGARFNEMTRIWKEEGHLITVVAGNLEGQTAKKSKAYKGKFITRQEQDGILVLRCNVSESYNKSFRGRIWAYFSFVFSGTIAGLFKARGKYDVILVSSPPLFVGIIAYVLSKFKRIPFVFEVRDLWPESAIDTNVLKSKTLIKMAYWFEKFIYKRAKLINVLTPAFYRILRDKKSVSPNKLIEISNASDFNMSEELLIDFDRDKFRNENNFQDKFVITYVGAHGVANGLDQVLDAAKLLLDTNVLFVLVGDGMQKEKLQKRALDMELPNIVFFAPVPKKEALKYILASEMGMSVLLKNDTFKTIYSNKTFDYMSCKKPILMAIDGISRELIEKADAGVFVEPEKPKDFAQKIRLYLSNPELIKIQGENGYKYAKENFDRDVLAKKYLAYITKIKD